MAALRIGLIGCGTIGAAFVRGLCKSDVAVTFAISPRNEKKSLQLAEEFPEKVSRKLSNQDVVDDCDLLVLAVLPKHAHSIISPLTVPQTKRVLTFIAMVSSSALASALSRKEDSLIVRAVPLPSIEQHMGITTLCPPDEQIEMLFNALGSAVPVANVAQMTSLQAVTCLMGPFYAQLRTAAAWAEQQGVPRDSAARYVAHMYRGIANDACVACDASSSPFDDLVNEQTPGGLNAGAIAQLEDSGMMTSLARALDTAQERLKPQLDDSSLN